MSSRLDFSLSWAVMELEDPYLFNFLGGVGSFHPPTCPQRYSCPQVQPVGSPGLLWSIEGGLEGTADGLALAQGQGKIEQITEVAS